MQDKFHYTHKKSEATQKVCLAYKIVFSVPAISSSPFSSTVIHRPR